MCRRLLENGEFRLLEDGETSFRLLEVGSCPPPYIEFSLFDDEVVFPLMFGGRIVSREVLCVPEPGPGVQPCKPQNLRVDCCDKVKP